jgi:hypothetical protein
MRLSTLPLGGSGVEEKRILLRGVKLLQKVEAFSFLPPAHRRRHLTTGR